MLYTDAEGGLPRAGHGLRPERELNLPEVFRFSLDGGALDDQVQEVAWRPPARESEDPAGQVTSTWRARRPIPAEDDFFENVWREYREHGAVH